MMGPSVLHDCRELLNKQQCRPARAERRPARAERAAGAERRTGHTLPTQSAERRTGPNAERGEGRTPFLFWGESY